MTKDDFMKLPKERLAELLAENETQTSKYPFVINEEYVPCWAPNGWCSNPFHDCINCPKQSTGGSWTTNTTTSSKNEQE